MSAFNDLTSILDGLDLYSLFDDSPNASLTYFNVTSASNIPIHKPIAISEQQVLLKKHYQPEKSGDIAYFYDSLPEDEMWKLLVDLKKQQTQSEQGYMGYERREKGAIQCLLNAFKYVCETINEPLTPDYIRNIHRIAAKSCPPILQGLNGWSGPSYMDIRAGEFKTSNFGTITMSPSCITPLGLVEMKRDFSHCNKEGTYVGIKPIKGDYRAEVLKLVTTLEEDLECSNPFAKLKAIDCLRNN